MNTLLTLLFTIYFFASSAVLYCVAVVFCLITSPFDKNRRWLHYFSCAWGNHYLWFSPFWLRRIEGKEKIDKNKTYIYVANHQSYFDIFTLYGLYTPFKWVSKEEIFRMPFVGGNLKLNQYVCISRGNIGSIKQMLNDCRNWLQRGVPIMLFPEGTRSETGEIGRFRDGAFRLAIECKVPVVPVVLDGTFDIYNKHDKTVNPKGSIVTYVLDPVEPTGFQSSAAMRDYVEDLMKQKLLQVRKERLKPVQPQAEPVV